MSHTSEGRPPDPGHGANNPAVGHERRDANIRLVVWTGVTLVGVVIVIRFWMHETYDLLTKKESRLAAGASPVAVFDSQRPMKERLDALTGPPNVAQEDLKTPRLEGLQPRAEELLYAQRGGTILQPTIGEVRPENLLPANQSELQKYGPADPADPGFVRLPIDVAMQLMVKQNLLPAAPGGEAASGRPGIDLPNQANSGRGIPLAPEGGGRHGRGRLPGGGPGAGPPAGAGPGAGAPRAPR